MSMESMQGKCPLHKYFSVKTRGGGRLRDFKLVAASILYPYVHKCTFVIGNAKFIAAEMQKGYQ